MAFARLSSAQNAVLLEWEGRIEIARAGTTNWTLVRTNQALLTGDRLRTGPNSRAVVRLSDRTTKRFGEDTIIQVPPASPSGPVLNLLKGVIYFFHRDKPGRFPVQTPSAYAVVLGTEFSVAVADDGSSTFRVLDGKVAITNAAGTLNLRSGESAVAAPGQAPVRTAALPAANVVQWVLYYPAVLDVSNLQFDPALRASLDAYRSGDLLFALAAYPKDRKAASEAERVYRAALLLAVGNVVEAEALLPGSEKALRVLIAAVKRQPNPVAVSPQNASELLAQSYYAQSEARLEDALKFARQAVAQSPQFGFAWARVAELEFSFGRIRQTETALQRALSLAPRHAEALALRGFVSAAKNEIDQALQAFDQAIAIDGALGNAWLGRGLCRLRLGKSEAGLQDLQVAATLEPQRAVLRSYLGKGFATIGDQPHANEELRLAKTFDPDDPTAWLYSALLRQQENRINEAVEDLEMSENLAENRRIYRSGLLIDQDRAVREANLASVYEDAGMQDVAARAASRSVSFDPGNYSAHLFLGNAYQRQRDLRGVNQRFETPAVSEFLLANLLAPASAGTLAQSVSEQEYSRLFERDGYGISSATEYFSNGDWLQSGAVYGLFDNTSYAFSGYHRSDNGQRINDDFLQTEISFQLKQQLTLQDSLYLRTIFGDIEGGDVIPRYDPDSANPGFRFREHQLPLLLAGYHREWSPGNHTLLLGGWFRDEISASDPRQAVLVFGRDGAGNIADVSPISIEQEYRSRAELFSLEAQQIWQRESQGFIVGGRYQGGAFESHNVHTNAAFIFPFLFPEDPQRTDNDLRRWSVYGYYHVQPIESLLLVAGLSYDWLRFPENFRFAPLSEGHDTESKLSPKAGVVWTPRRDTTVRIGYSQSQGGVGFEQSFRIEPTEIAGFNQSFRSLIPESVVGANVAAPFEVYGASFEQRFPTRTYLIAGGEILKSDFRRVLGAYDFSGLTITPGFTHENLDYEERALFLVLNQLVGNEWAFGLRYRLSQAQLDTAFVDIPGSAATLAGFSARRDLEAVLHHADLFAIFNHPSGFFGRADAVWYGQSNQGYSPDIPGDDFWQFNLFAGWRFLQRRIELRAGILNLFDQDYRLNPLNLTPDLPRDRTFTVSLKFTF